MGANRPEHSNQAYDYAKQSGNAGQAMQNNAIQAASRNMRNVLYTVGGVLMLIMAVLMLPQTLHGILYYNMGVAVVGMALGVGFGWLAAKLLKSAGRMRRAERYRAFLSGWAGCTLKEMSKATGRSVDYLKRDLSSLIERGELGNAWLDRTDGVLFADEASYRDYTLERRMRQKQKQQERNAKKREMEPGFAGEVNRFQRQVKEICPEIDDLTVRAKVETLSALIGEIRDWVKEHPDGEGKVKRLSNYYLPTTLKLLNTYISVDDNPGPTAQNICKNVSDILDTFHTALLNMQDSLLDDTALDVSAEISALESMLQQEGLAGSEFSFAPVRGEE